MSAPTRPSPGAEAAPGYERSGLTLLMACGATFIAFMAVSVVYIAFTSLQKSFPHASLSSLSWVVSGYTVVFAASLAPAGRLADVIGRRRLFLLSVAGFTGSSLLCALAPTVWLLVAFCALQGLFAAGLIPSALSLVLSSRAPEKRSGAIGLWGASSSAAAAVGPPLGGLLVNSFGWPAVFLLNVPLGVLLLVAAARVLPKVAEPRGGLPDLLGTAALLLGVGGVVAALTEGGSWGWTSPLFLGVAIVGVLLLTLAVLRSRRHAVPALEISLLRSRKFTTANVAFVLFGASLYCWLLAAPLFTTEVWHYTALRAGLALAPGAVMSVIASATAGRLARRNQRTVVVIGAVLAGLQCGIWGLGVRGEPDFWVVWLPASLIGGIGVGMVMTSLSSAAAGALPPQQFAGGAGMAMTSRQLGAALGTGSFAALMAAIGDHSLAAFRAVFLLTAVLAFLAALVAVFLTDRTHPRGTHAAGAADRTEPRVPAPQQG